MNQLSNSSLVNSTTNHNSATAVSESEIERAVGQLNSSLTYLNDRLEQLTQKLASVIGEDRPDKTVGGTLAEFLTGTSSLAKSLNANNDKVSEAINKVNLLMNRIEL